jgi:hypothetical protein
LRIAHKSFILSAAHVFESCPRSTLYLPGQHALEQLTGTVFKNTIAVGVSRRDDPIDIAIMEISADRATAIQQSYCFLTPECLDANDVGLPGRYYEFRGYPASRTHVNPTTKKIRRSLFSFLTPCASPTIYVRTGFNPNLNLLLPFDRKHVGNEQGTHSVAPHPRGISGGGIWRRTIDSFSEDLSKSGKLVAIFTEYHEQQKTVVGVRIALFLEAIRAKYPELRLSIPVCNNVRIHVSA